MREIEISKILGLSKSKKYEITCASFDVVDHIFKVEIPRSMKHRKLAVQAMNMLAEGHIQYGYEKSRPDPKTLDATSAEAEAPTEVADTSEEE